MSDSQAPNDDPAGIGRLVASHIARGATPGAAWAVRCRAGTFSGGAGTLDLGADRPVDDRSLFRIASMTKPVLAVATLALVEQGRFGLDDPVDPWLPELADRRVLVDPDGPLDRTVPARRAITIEDLLTFRLGIGIDFSRFDRQPVLAALAEAGLAPGPPRPRELPPPDELMALLGSVPLERQPGERWLYHLGAEVLGVLLARATGAPLASVLDELVLAPLGMTDTGFHVPAPSLGRFGPCYGTAPAGDADAGGGRFVFDGTDGQWAAPPVFPSGGAGLVSSAADFVTFGSMLLDGGVSGEVRVVSQRSVAAMTTNHLSAEQVALGSPDPSGAVGWGYGVGVRIRETGPTETATSYGWMGGLGSSWTNDPAEGLVAVLLTNEMLPGPVTPALHQDFLTAAYELARAADR